MNISHAFVVLVFALSPTIPLAFPPPFFFTPGGTLIFFPQVFLDDE